jgi:hypothetical protein
MYLPPPTAPVPATVKGRVRVKQVSLASLARFGLVLGVLSMSIPGFGCGVGSLLLVQAARRYLEGIQPITIGVLGQNLGTVDIVKMLGLANALDRLRVLEATGFLAVLGITVAFAILGGLFVGLLTMLVGMGYNILAWLTGGVEVELG